MHKDGMPHVSEWSYDMLMAWCTREAVDAFIRGGGKELRAHMGIIFNVICQWTENDSD